MSGQVLMRGKTDCGVSALASASGLPYEQVAGAFDALNGDRRDDLNDSPWHHDAAMRRLRIRSRIVTCGDILAGRTCPRRVVVLVHDPASPLLRQHWVTINWVDLPRARVNLWWGLPATPERAVSFDTFRQLYSAGAPACAYEVGVGTVRGLPWYSRAWVWLTETIF